MTEETGVYPADSIAKLLKITPRRLQQLAAEGWIPKQSHGKYNLVASVQGYIDFLKGSTADTENGERVDYRAEKAMLMRANRIAREMENDMISKRLIRADEVEVEMRALFSTFVGFLSTIPDILERDCGIGGAAAERVQQAIDEARDRLHSVLG